MKTSNIIKVIALIAGLSLSATTFASDKGPVASSGGGGGGGAFIAGSYAGNSGVKAEVALLGQSAANNKACRKRKNKNKRRCKNK